MVLKGCKVTYFASEGFKDKVEAVGAKFFSYGDCFPFSTTRDNTNILHTAKEMVEASEAILNKFFPIVTKNNYDLVIYDVSAIWGIWFAKILKVPYICCFPGLAPQMRQYIKSRTIITKGIWDSWEGMYDYADLSKIKKRILEKYNIPYISSSALFQGSPDLNIIFTSPYFQPFSENMINFVFIGPTLQARHESVTFPFDQLDPTKKIIYISMGTLYKQDLVFFKTCFEAFKNMNYQIIVSVGKAVNIEELGPIPNNFIVKNYVPQLEVLQRADVFISHAGMNGISEAMFYNVPVLLLPKTIEQQINARRIEELGAGIDTKAANSTPEVLRMGVANLLNNNTYKEMAKLIGQSFKSTKGNENAVEVMINFITKHKNLNNKNNVPEQNAWFF